jgi:hypothetical protein
MRYFRIIGDHLLPIFTQTNPVQLRAVLSSIQMALMSVTRNWRSTLCTALQPMLELELLSNHPVQMQILRFATISS